MTSKGPLQVSAVDGQGEAGDALELAGRGAMWRLERTRRVASGQIEDVREERSCLEAGRFDDGLLVTPRSRQERNVFWSALVRRHKRREGRVARYNALDEREAQLTRKLEKAKRGIIKRAALPPLHLEMLRRPGVVSAEFLELAAEQVNQRGPQGYHAIHIAVLQGQRDILAALLAQPGCDVNVRDATGYTALHLALVEPCKHDMARALVRAGAGLLERNREGLSPVEVALSHGLYNPMARFLEKNFTAWELACRFAQRFFEEYFEGNPDYHHYKKEGYENAMLMAYMVVQQPWVLRVLWPARLSALRLAGKPHTMNNLERFFHVYSGALVFDSRYDAQLDKRTIKPRRRVPRPLGAVRRALKRRRGRASDAGEQLAEDATSQLMVVRREQKKLRKAVAELEEEERKATATLLQSIPALFRDFPMHKVVAWRNSALAWKFNKGGLFAAQIAKYAFQGTLTAEQVQERMAEGRTKYKAWRELNSKVLAEDEVRRMREVADAVRLRRVQEDRARKREEDRLAAEQERRDRHKKGLDKIDPNACVQLSETRLLYSADDGICTGYTIALGTQPKGTVLIKLSVTTLDGEGKPQFSVAPSLVTFTAANWNEPRFVDIEPVDDDAIVRMKRAVAQEAAGACDHLAVQTIQSSTDWSYKHPDLRWEPGRELRIHVK